jgi:hypothetical protein
MTIEGVWDLPMSGAARLQIEHQHNWIRNMPYISVGEIDGAVAARGGTECRLPPDRGSNSGFSPRSRSAFPEGSSVVILRVRLDGLASTAASLGTDAGRNEHPPRQERSLATRERATLHLIIVALARAARLDLSHPYKVGEMISALVAQLGHTVAVNTVASHLKAALETTEDREA